MHSATGKFRLTHGAIVIAAITSCTNTSNPSVMLAAGILARKAVARGLTVKPWVKTSLAPGSKVVTQYLKRAGLTESLEKLRFNLVGYGCTTCIGNSGPIDEALAGAIKQGNLVACAILSGNRNFEGRINPAVRFNYLASPPLVVAYAIAGTMDIDVEHQPLGTGSDGHPVFLRDIWPSQEEVAAAVIGSVHASMFKSEYGQVFEGDDHWKSLKVPEGNLFRWAEDSLYVKAPPFFYGVTAKVGEFADISGARALAMLGDSVTTDHISPAGSIAADSPAGKYLIERGVQPKDFNSYGARRGNHEVMMRGTLANIRLKNLMVPGVEGGFTAHQPDGMQMTIFDASEQYRKEGVPLIVIAGKEYGTGSSRDWAAKGVQLLGVRAVIAENFERIHRSNLIGMGVLALEFKPGENRQKHGLTGKETFSISGLRAGIKPRQTLKVRAEAAGKAIEFDVTMRADTPEEVEYIRHGGILPFVLRELMSRLKRPAYWHVEPAGGAGDCRGARGAGCGWSLFLQRRIVACHAFVEGLDLLQLRLACGLGFKRLELEPLRHRRRGIHLVVARRILHWRKNRRRQHQVPANQHYRGRITLSHPQSVTDFSG